MKNVTIYTDGACSNNPGPGGWAAVLIYKGTKKQISGFDPETTNNRMELKAVLEALNALKEPCNVTLFTDSSYIHNAFEKRWIDNWLENGWKTAAKKPVENQQLWQDILDASKQHNISWQKVKGHAGDKYNTVCDKLATGAIKENVKKQESDKEEQSVGL
jgi:ribonuclease HI